MTNINKRLISGILFSALCFLFLCAVSPGSAISSQDTEEDADMVLVTDTVIVGEMNTYSKDLILVDGYEYSLCKEVKVFNKRNKKIPFHDIDAAEKVKIFESINNCVRKIKVLRFAQ